MIAAHGPVGSDVLSDTLTKARAVFPEAYQKTTRGLWIEATTTKIPEATAPIANP